MHPPPKQNKPIGKTEPTRSTEPSSSSPKSNRIPRIITPPSGRRGEWPPDGGDDWKTKLEMMTTTGTETAVHSGLPHQAKENKREAERKIHLQSKKTMPSATSSISERTVIASDTTHRRGRRKARLSRRMEDPGIHQRRRRARRGGVIVENLTKQWRQQGGRHIKHRRRNLQRSLHPSHADDL
ncbi:hypothetical protein Dimus_026798 [Dionaea muscipula]